MKYISLFILFLLVSISAFGQNDVTKFLGIPVDGPKSEMVKALKSKGFKQNSIGDNEYFSGRFNGMDVQIYISLESGKVSRLMVCDENTMGEGDIKIRFNKLCQQFKDNGKYLYIDDFTISNDEDISYEMALHNKRYEAIFYQLPEGYTLESLQSSILQNIQNKYSQEQIDNASDEFKSQIFEECASELLKAVQNKPVWFMIAELYGKYYITMFYDNELNRAQGQDL